MKISETHFLYGTSAVIQLIESGQMLFITIPKHTTELSVKMSINQHIFTGKLMFIKNPDPTLNPEKDWVLTLKLTPDNFKTEEEPVQKAAQYSATNHPAIFNKPFFDKNQPYSVNNHPALLSERPYQVPQTVLPPGVEVPQQQHFFRTVTHSEKVAEMETQNLQKTVLANDKNVTANKVLKKSKKSGKSTA